MVLLNYFGTLKIDDKLKHHCEKVLCCRKSEYPNEFQKIKKSNEHLSVNCIYGIADLVSSRCIMTFKIYITIGK